jgi:hypothetical protein
MRLGARSNLRTGDDPYQIDHVFGDAATEARVTARRINRYPATRPRPYSDHASIMVTLGEPARAKPAAHPLSK